MYGTVDPGDPDRLPCVVADATCPSGRLDVFVHGEVSAVRRVVAHLR
jgi:hypothetical protein